MRSKELFHEKGSFFVLPDETRCLPERKKDYFAFQKCLTIKIEKEVAMIHVEGVEDSSGNRK